jgi:hypothetical protein
MVHGRKKKKIPTTAHTEKTNFIKVATNKTFITFNTHYKDKNL